MTNKFVWKPQDVKVSRPGSGGGTTSSGVSRITYWFYWFNKPIASVRAIPGLPDETVQAIALNEHEVAPTHFGDYPDVDPGTHRRLLKCAEIRRG